MVNILKTEEDQPNKNNPKFKDLPCVVCGNKQTEDYQCMCLWLKGKWIKN